MAMMDPMQIQTMLSDADFPCTKDELIDQLEDQGADEATLDMIQGLDMDRFDSIDDVTRTLGMETIA